MAIIKQEVTDKYAIYNGDSLEVMAKMPDGRIDFSIYSPPFGGLYAYSSSERDLSNCKDYEQFLAHYEFFIKELFRLTKPGRMTAVHCMDVPLSNTGCDTVEDFPGDLIRIHKRIGFDYCGRYCVWKEPLSVRLRTMAKNLAHATIVDDSSKCSMAGADYLCIFRRKGKNAVPIAHPTGLLEYAGARPIPHELQVLKSFDGDQILNRYSHWIWRNYASAFWDDVRVKRVLPFEASRDNEDERHVHPLQLDVIDRAITLWSNPSEVVFTPFMGVGSEVYGAVTLGRRAVGVELKPSYFKQAQANMKLALSEKREQDLLAGIIEEPTMDWADLETK